MKFFMRLATALAFASLFVGYAGAASTQRTITLTSTGVFPSATGTASIVEQTTGKNVEQSLVVDVSALGGLAVYLVKVDGKLAGALNTDAAGAASLDLSTNPKRCQNSLPATINLSNAKLIEVTDEAGAVVLTGMFP